MAQQQQQQQQPGRAAPPTATLSHSPSASQQQDAAVAASVFSQQVLEQKERELHESIALNYGRIRDVERELRELQMQVKLTAGPKKAALELLRHKIEAQDAKVQGVRRRHDAAKKAYEALQAELEGEEVLKQRLCDELSTLVSTSVSSQLERFEQLKAKLEALQGNGGGGGSGGGMGRSSSAPVAQGGAGAAAAAAGGAAAECAAPQQEQQQEQQRLPGPAQRSKQEAEAAAARAACAAEAAAARSRHVQLPGALAPHAPGARPAAAAAAAQQPPPHARQPHKQQALQQSHGRQLVTGPDGRFAGFDS